jgi:hypothetical protein
VHHFHTNLAPDLRSQLLFDPASPTRAFWTAFEPLRDAAIRVNAMLRAQAPSRAPPAGGGGRGNGGNGNGNGGGKRDRNPRPRPDADGRNPPNPPGKRPRAEALGGNGAGPSSPNGGAGGPTVVWWHSNVKYSRPRPQDPAACWHCLRTHNGGRGKTCQEPRPAPGFTVQHRAAPR